jgi:hypothetical protein
VKPLSGGSTEGVRLGQILEVRVRPRFGDFVLCLGRGLESVWPGPSERSANALPEFVRPQEQIAERFPHAQCKPALAAMFSLVMQHMAALAEVSLSEIKSEHSDDVIRRELGLRGCAQRPQ